MGPPTGARAYSRAEVISVFSQAHMINCGASYSGRYHAHLARLLLGGLHANQIVASNFRKLHLKTVRNSGFRLCEDPWCQNGRDKRISAHSGSEVTRAWDNRVQLTCRTGGFLYSYKFFRSPDLSWKREDPYTASKKSFFPDGNKEQLRILHFDEFEVVPKRVQHLEALAIGNHDRFPNSTPFSSK